VINTATKEVFLPAIIFRAVRDSEICEGVNAVNSNVDKTPAFVINLSTLNAFSSIFADVGHI